MSPRRGRRPRTRPGRVRAVLLAPLQPVGVAAFGLWLMVRHPFVRRRLRRRYRALAARLGIDRGTVLRFDVTGGAMVTPRLDVVSLWPGPPDDVVADVVAGVLGTGYEEVLRTRPGVPVRRLSFRAPQGQGLPGLGMLVSRPGELIEGTDVRVPPETTGLRFAL